MRYKAPYITAACALLACSPSSTNEASNVPDALETVSIVATSELNPDEKIIKATVAPKPGFMAWTGHILLLSETGKIYSTNTGFGGFTEVSEGPFTDITGLSRGDNPAIFLAIDAAGELKAFEEAEEAEFEPIPVSSNSADIQAFCYPETPSETHFFGMTLQGVVKLDYTVIDNNLVEISSSNDPQGNQTGVCFDKANGDFAVLSPINSLTTFKSDGNQDKVHTDISSHASFRVGDTPPVDLGLPPGSENLLAQSDNFSLEISIDQGLSIYGIDQPGWIYSTSAPMGNTFNQGLTLVGDANSNRIVMIANDYIQQTLSNPPAEQSVP